MSTVQDTPRPGVDGWFERTSVVGRLETRWLERTLDVRTGRVEYYCGDYAREVTATRSTQPPRRTTPASLTQPPPAPAVKPREAVTLQHGASQLHVTLNPRAVRVLYDEIRAQSHAIETRGLETGGGADRPAVRAEVRP